MATVMQKIKDIEDEVRIYTALHLSRRFSLSAKLLSIFTINFHFNRRNGGNFKLGAQLTDNIDD